MPLPYSYKNKIPAETENLRGRFPDALGQQFKRNDDKIVEKSRSHIEIHTRNSLFKQGYEFTVELETQNQDKSLVYHINLEPLLRSALFIFIGCAFFLFLSVTEFLIYGTLITLAYYLINFFFLHAYIQKNIDIYAGNKEYDSKEQAELIKNQKEWEKNPDKCPACGEDTGNFDLYCPDCGIRVRRDTDSIPLNISKYQNMSIHYSYKKDKKNENPPKRK